MSDDSQPYSNEVKCAYCGEPLSMHGTNACGGFLATQPADAPRPTRIRGRNVYRSSAR